MNYEIRPAISRPDGFHVVATDEINKIGPIIVGYFASRAEAEAFVSAMENADAGHSHDGAGREL